ncbi:30S ribosomal protein S3 [bacterium]|nr:30S ribosomal protein S3 [bacterium]
MGNKVNANGLRVGVIKNWLSTWFSGKRIDYTKNLHEDLKVREFINETFKSAEIQDIEINRSPSAIEIVVYVGRPGMAIGREGKLIEKAKKDMQRVISVKTVDLQIKGVQQPQFSARIIAQQIADGIERRRSVKSLVKRAIEAAQRSSVQGMKIWVAGRLTGGEHANMYKKQMGRVPLQTLRADIDYAYVRAKSMNAGILSVKVWIYKGEIY